MITIQGRLPSLNEYINKCRHDRYAGAGFKRKVENDIMWQIKINASIKTPCELKMTFYEPNKRRDYDNIVSAKKYILDAMEKLGIIPRDSQKHITRIYDEVLIDKDNPRVTVEVLYG